MRGADTSTQSLFTMRRLEDFTGVWKLQCGTTVPFLGGGVYPIAFSLKQACIADVRSFDFGRPLPVLKDWVRPKTARCNRSQMSAMGLQPDVRLSKLDGGFLAGCSVHLALRCTPLVLRHAVTLDS